MRQKIFALVLATLTIAACGGDDDDGVDGSLTLDALSADERVALCNEVQSSAPSDADSHRVDCYASALFGGSADCQADVDACLAEPPAPEEDEPCADAEDAVLPDCANEVTVSELRACVRAQSTVLGQIADEISCESDPDDLLTQVSDASAPCDLIDEQCPDLLDSISTDS
jgi:hypothetical protein